MDEENIYEDLDNFILEQQVGQVQENNKELQQTIEKLEQTTKKFTEEISELKNINQNLERNISALFKTAKNEIERKDKQISELRRELDNFMFRRGGNRKGQKCVENSDELQKEIERFKGMIEQKNRIIQSLNKELETIKKEFADKDKHLKRNASHFEDDDLRSKLGKKRKLDDKVDYKRDKSRRPRSRSKSRESRFDSRLKSRFDKKRTIRRNRSGSFEKRRSSIIEKHRSKHENSKYSKSRSRSPASHKSYNSNSKFSEKNRTNPSQYKEKINKIKSRSRSTSVDRKKYQKHNEKSEVFTDKSDKKCQKKVIHNNNLIKEDSGMSSSNSHTPDLLLKCDEIKADLLLEEIKVEDLEEGEIDCSLEDIDSEEDNIDFKEKVVSLKKENTWKTSKVINTKLDKKEIKKSIERPKKIMENKSELNIVKSEKEKPTEKENKNMETTNINTNKSPEIKSELVTKKPVMVEENEINDHLKGSQDVLELMVQNNYLDDLDIDEEIIKMQLLDDDKRKKRKEDKQRISKLRTAISECKQNIELLEHNFYSDEESETEDEFNKTGSCIEENIVNTKQNNLVLKISKGTIVKSNAEPKTVNLKDVIKHKQSQKIDDVLNKNQLGTNTNNKQEIVDKIETKLQNEVLDKNVIDTNKKENPKHMQKPEEILVQNAIDTNKKDNLKPKILKSNHVLDKNILDADKKESTKDVTNKSIKETQKIDLKSSKDNLEIKVDKDNQIKNNKSLEDDNRKKRKDTNEKCNKTNPSSSKHEKPEKTNTNKSVHTNSTIDKIETCTQEKDKIKCTKTESVEFEPKIAEKIPENELLEAISSVVDNVKIDGIKLEQNFANITNITNLESAVSEVQNRKPIIDDTIEKKLNEILNVENEKKENVLSTQTNDNDKETINAVTKSKENETERKPPLKARRRRAFICIT